MRKYVTCFCLGICSFINLLINILSIEPHLTVVDAFGRGNDPYSQFMSIYFSVNLGILILSIGMAIVIKLMVSPKLKRNMDEAIPLRDEPLEGSPSSR